MATILYNQKTGEKAMFQAKYVQSYLKSGWDVVPPEKVAPEAVEVEVSEEDSDDKDIEVSEDDLRSMAKELGIKNYWNKNIDKLEQEVNESL